MSDEDKKSDSAQKDDITKFSSGKDDGFEGESEINSDSKRELDNGLSNLNVGIAGEAVDVDDGTDNGKEDGIESKADDNTECKRDEDIENETDGIEDGIETGTGDEFEVEDDSLTEDEYVNNEFATGDIELNDSNNEPVEDIDLDSSYSQHLEDINVDCTNKESIIGSFEVQTTADVSNKIQVDDAIKRKQSINNINTENIETSETYDKAKPNLPADKDRMVSHHRRLVDFEKEYRKDPEEISICDRLKTWTRRKYEQTSARKILFSNLPFITMIRNYKRTDIVPDLIAGSTAGAMMIPQGMAFGALSTLPPIVGLYISLFAPLTYFFLGTCRQISMGCIAVLSLMMADILDLYDENTKIAAASSTVYSTDNMTTLFTDDISPDIQAKRIEVAAAVTFVVGMITILLSKLGLGFVTCFMSNSLITSFTVGVSIHVFTSQLKNGLGLKLERKSGLFKLPKTWYEVCIHLPETNIATLITWFICIIIIYLVKAQINDRFKKKMKIPIPIELIMVIFGTVASYYLELNSKYQVKIVEYIPKGIPSPKLPDVTLATDYLADGILIAVVSYAQTVALAKTFGLLHKYEIDPDQEMFACGGANVVCSLFSGYITAASVSRTVVVNGAGGKTQVTSLIACSIVLLVIVVLAPYFYYLPLCVLAAIIVVNLRGMFWKLTQLNPLRKQSKSDFIVWVVTFSVSVFVDVIPGLLAGIAVSFLLIIIITQQSPVTLKGVVDGTQETRTPSLYHSVDLSSDIKILHINKPLCFANSDIFVQKVFKNIDINIIKVQKQKAKLIKSEKNANASNHNDNELKDLEPIEAENKIDDTQDVMLSLETDMSLPKYVILDISGVSFIDLMGASALQLIITELKEIDIKVLITNVAVVVYDTLDRVDFIKKNEDCLYLTLFDALQDIRLSSDNTPNIPRSQDTTEA